MDWVKQILEKLSNFLEKSGKSPGILQYCFASHPGKASKDVFVTFLLVFFVSLKESTCETRKNVFHFTSKALFVLKII